MYRRHWLLSACTSNSGQQKIMRLTEGTYAWKAEGMCLGDLEGAKCTYDGRELYQETVFELLSFSNDW